MNPAFRVRRIEIERSRRLDSAASGFWSKIFVRLSNSAGVRGVDQATSTMASRRPSRFRPLFLLIFLFASGPLHAASAPAPEARRAAPPPPAVERFRGGQFQWARLQTDGVYWNRHANGDPALLNYLRRTTVLKIDPVWHSVRAASVEALNVYPFIYCDNISYLASREAANLAEYLRRGGFLFIDACHNNTINRSIPAFQQAQIRLLKSLFPNLRMEQLPSTHQIYSIYFKVAVTPPYWRGMDPQYPMYAIYDGDHLVGIMNLTGLQCGWTGDNGADYAAECAQMMTNIYIYAMTR
jgi:hypothetical protein